jgi:hypothetical protein
MEETKKTFSPVGFVLVSIFLLCVLWTGVKWQPILHEFGMELNGPTGLALLLFGGLFHLVALCYTAFKAKDTPASILIGIFCAFWLYLGLGFMLYPPGKVAAPLVWILPAMIIAVYLFARNFYDNDERRKLADILIFGLDVIMFILWASDLTKIAGYSIVEDVFNWASRIYLPILGIWALVLALPQIKKSEGSPEKKT